MKTISIQQPYASLIMWGYKTIETRSWNTLWRGPLAIHASSAWTKELALLSKEEPFRSLLLNHDYDEARELPRGVVLGSVHLVETHRTEDILDLIDPIERQLGNYTVGRFAFYLADPSPLILPLARRGALGIFNIDEEDLHHG